MNTIDAGTTFAELELCESIQKALSLKGYTQPTPIQLKAIPHILEGSDLMASAQTGTGKTAGFTLPLLERLRTGEAAAKKHARVLILTPTRELAAQVHQSVEDYGKHLSLSSAVIFGGVKIEPQIRKLSRGVDFLIATPGRLMDLYGQKAVKFDQIETLVLDEADRMLDMGFLAEIRRIQKLLPDSRQTLLFSATFSTDIRGLAKQMLKSPVEVDVAPKNSTASAIKQLVYTVDKKQKTRLLSHLISENKSDQVLVFSRTKHGANRLVRDLYKDGIPATAIHGNKSQNQRTKALADFKNGRASVLVATDIAARGIDIQDLPLVVNYDLPNVAEDYVHRIGRTGRAGSSGMAISLVCADEIKQLQGIEKLIQKKLEREEIEGFEAAHSVPASKAITPLKPKKPKKTRNALSPNRGASRDSSQRSSQGGSQGASRHSSNSSSNGSARRNTSSDRAQSGARTGDKRGNQQPRGEADGNVKRAAPVATKPDVDGNLKTSNNASQNRSSNRTSSRPSNQPPRSARPNRSRPTSRA